MIVNNVKSVEGLSVDWVSKNLYFTDNVIKAIGVVRLKSQAFMDKRLIITGTVL